MCFPHIPFRHTAVVGGALFNRHNVQWLYTSHSRHAFFLTSIALKSTQLNKMQRKKIIKAKAANTLVT